MILASAAAHVRFGDQGKEVAARHLTHRDDQSFGALFLDRKEWQLVREDQARHVLALVERRAETPQDAASFDFAPTRVPARRHAAAFFAGTRWLRNVVQ